MRAVLLIIDSFGMGALPDAADYGDDGANTALHICEHLPGKKWPWLQKLGLGNAANLLGYDLPGCDARQNPMAGYGVMQARSPGKDTTTGHWELAGIVLDRPFQTFPQNYPSFPRDLVESFERRTGHPVLGNLGISGTKVIDQLGEKQMNGDGIIVYTSADSVLQIAAHEDVIPPDELYRICETARTICDGYNVGRVIARPFTGSPGAFVRTRNRKDFSMRPVRPTILDHLQNNGIETVAIGKIGDIFCEQGIDKSYHDAGNPACLDRTLECLKKKGEKDQFLFINLVDTDMLFGHRRDISGYHDAVQRIDDRLESIIGFMSDEDLLIITADHGCDPGFKGTDHTREYVPLLVFQKKGNPGSLGIRTGFCDVAQSLAAYFKTPAMADGKTFI